MPKRHRRLNSFKPEATVHHSLTTSRSHHDASRSDERSVNDLIQRLRRTQQSSRQKQNAADAAHITRGSIHPSLRSLLDLPEAPPPRPRHGLRPRVGTQRLRRTPGPAAPMSWLSPTSNDDLHATTGTDKGDYQAEWRRRLDQLPGVNFPSHRSFQHMILKAMACNWDWHLVYDGEFLSELPTHVKHLLLSYIAVYTEHASMEVGMQGLKPLFLDQNSEGEVDMHPEVSRLDLSGALGRWTSLRVFRRELKAEVPLSTKQTTQVPTSWEEELNDEGSSAGQTGLVPDQPFIRRFENLRYLSLAQPAPAAANWASLLSLLSNLATLTHLSLAHWPVPTLSMSTATKRHSLTSSTRYSSSSEANMSEAAMVLGKLSRMTYCLEWLDLEGCTDWLSALCWNEIGEKTLGPEWNGSWRGVSWLGLGPGWTPEFLEEVAKTPLSERPSTILPQAASTAQEDAGTRWSTLQSPSTPAANLEPAVGAEQTTEDTAVHKAARHRLQEKLWRHHTAKAENVRKRIQDFRYEGKGKWIEIRIGDDGLDVVSNRAPVSKLLI